MAKDHITRLLADTSGFDSQVGKSMRFVTDFYKSIDELNKGMIGLSEQQKSLLINMGKVQPTTKSAEVAVAQLEYVCNTLEKSYAKMSDSIKSKDWAQSIGANVKQLQDRIASLKSEMASMPKKAYVSPVTTFEPISGGAGAAGGAVAAAGGKNLFGKIMGGNLAARAVMDTLRFVKDTVKDAVQANMEFEYSNATLSAVLGKTKEEIMDLTIQAQRLGSTSLYSAKEISELQIVLARLGFNQTEIKDSTDAIAKLALATGVDLEKAATLTGSTLRAFGYSTKEAARVASVLGVATTKSALDMEKLRTSMAYASSVARQAGFEIEDVVAMLGKMVDNGQQATTAGVNMRNIMLDLSNKSSKLSRAIKEVTGKDQVKNFDEFVDALRQMRDAGINLDDVANVVQKRVTPGFLNMIANTDGIAQLRDELKGCTGELDAMADKMENTLQGSVTKLGNAWNGLMLSFQNSMGPMRDVVQVLTEVINKANEWQSRNNGGQSQIASFEKGVSDTQKDEIRKSVEYRSKMGFDLEQDIVAANKEENDLIKERNKLLDQYNQKLQNEKNWKGTITAKVAGDVAVLGMNPIAMIGAVGTKIASNEAFNKSREELEKEIAALNDRINAVQYKKSLLTENGAGGGGSTSDSIREGVGLNLKELLTSKSDGVQKALENYAVAIREAEMEYNAGVISKKQYDQRILSAMENVYKAYGNAAASLADPKYKEQLNRMLAEERANVEKQFAEGKINQAEYNRQLQALNKEYGNLNAILETSQYKEGFEEWTRNVTMQAEKLAGDEHIDAVNKALQKYEQAIDKATLEKEAGVIDEVGFAKAQLAAQEQLTKVYEELALETDSEGWKAAFNAAVANTKQFAETLARLTEEANQLKDSKALNNRILRGLQGYAKQAGISYEQAGLSGKKEAINAMQLGDTIDWSGAVDILNGYLAKKHFQISVDLETGSIEKIKDQLAEAISNFSSRLGAVKTLVNFPNELKQAFEGLADTMNEGASAWDTMFAVFNTGFTILESVAGVMEAINTLQTLGNTLSLASAAAKGTETTATLAQADANMVDAETAGAAAAAEGGKAVSWLPIVGPILAVAAIAAIAAAIAASRKDTEYHANGGIVGMDGMRPRGTDVVPAMLTPGEVVLSHAMTNTLAGELQGAGRQMVMVQGESYITGEQVKIVYNNYAKRRGLKTRLA